MVPDYGSGAAAFTFNPQNLLKLILVIYLSAYFADNLPFRQGFFPLILPTLLMTGLALLILVVQRDLGTASIFIFLYAAILYLATGRKRVILASLFILVMAGVVGYFAVDIIQIRLIAWLNPWSDPSGSGYQTIQSLLAISNGGSARSRTWRGLPRPGSGGDFRFHFFCHGRGDGAHQHGPASLLLFHDYFQGYPNCHESTGYISDDSWLLVSPLTLELRAFSSSEATSVCSLSPASPCLLYRMAGLLC